MGRGLVGREIRKEEDGQVRVIGRPDPALITLETYASVEEAVRVRQDQANWLLTEIGRMQRNLDEVMSDLLALEA